MENHPEEDIVEEEEAEIDFFSFWILLSVQIDVTSVIFLYAASN